LKLLVSRNLVRLRAGTAGFTPAPAVPPYLMKGPRQDNLMTDLGSKIEEFELIPTLSIKSTTILEILENQTENLKPDVQLHQLPFHCVYLLLSH